MADGTGMHLTVMIGLVLALKACGGRTNEPLDANDSTEGGASGARPVAGSAGSLTGRGGTAGSSAGSSAGGSGGAVRAGSGGAVRAGSGGAVQAGSGGAVQAGSGGAVQAGSGGDVQAGSGGDVQAGSAGDSAGAGGDTTLPPPDPRPCSSSDGLGCAEDAFCVDIADDCEPSSSSGCDGYCAGRLGTAQCGPSRPCPEGFSCIQDGDSRDGVAPGNICISEVRACTSTEECPAGFVCLPESGCVPDRVDCSGNALCPAIPSPCPAGFLRSVVDGCWGPCVPIDRCQCGDGWLCESVGAECDRREDRCAVAVAPEPRCLLPFDGGPCDGALNVYAFVDGSCRAEIYGGCQGNENRFFSREECLLRCEGLGRQHDCPADRTPLLMCLECGVLGGCAQSATVCAKQCERDEDCDGRFACVDSHCIATPCL